MEEIAETKSARHAEWSFFQLDSSLVGLGGANGVPS